jgi:hypothetical protein
MSDNSGSATAISAAGFVSPAEQQRALIADADPKEVRTTEVRATVVDASVVSHEPHGRAQELVVRATWAVSGTWIAQDLLVLDVERRW